MYAIQIKETGHVLFIDPLEPPALFDYLRKQISGFEVTREACSVFCTHHHFDHDGGNETIVNQFPDVRIYGTGRVSCVTDVVYTNDKVLDIFNLLPSKHHTSDHISLYLRPTKTRSPLLFTGDSVFVGGSGKYFEGTGLDAYHCFAGIINMQPDTILFPGHEYAVDNLSFAVWLEPKNKDARNFLETCIRKRSIMKPVVGTTIKEELTYNPFMRCLKDGFQSEHVPAELEPAQKLDKIRMLKNQGQYKK